MAGHTSWKEIKQQRDRHRKSPSVERELEMHIVSKEEMEKSETENSEKGEKRVGT